MIFAYTLAIIGFLYYILPLIRICWGGIVIRKALMHLNRSEYMVLQNLKIPFENTVLKIDYVIISVYGVFVISKMGIIRTFSSIRGDESSPTWTQTIYQRFRLPLMDCTYKIQISNPILKVKEETKAVKLVLRDVFPSLTYLPMVVLTSRPKAIDLIDIKIDVTYFSSLGKVIREYNKRIFDMSDVREIYACFMNKEPKQPAGR